MTQYRIAFNPETQVAHILLPGHDLPDGSDEVGEFNASATGPTPTDASMQHVTTMLQRKGYTNLDRLTIEVMREPVVEVIEQEDLPGGNENGEGLETAIIPTEMSIGVGESRKLTETKVTGRTFTSSDEDVVKVSKAGELKGLKAGSATITVNSKNGTPNEVLVTVGEAAPAAFAGVGGSTEANEAGAQKAEPQPA
jgi:hypothetical protein